MTTSESFVLGVAVGECLIVLGALVATVISGRRYARIPERHTQLRHDRLVGIYRMLAARDVGHRTVLYAPGVEERMARLEISAEHVETVVDTPESSTCLPREAGVRLQRTIGGRVLKVRVSDPWPAFGPAYVTNAEWLPGDSLMAGTRRTLLTVIRAWVRPRAVT